MARSLTGRFYPPVIAAHEVVRTRLLEKCVPGTDLGVAFCTLVLGPAGFGKTTLLAQAYRELRSKGGKSLWLECSGLDVDPAHLLDSLYAAGSTVGMPTLEADFTLGDFVGRAAKLDGPITLFLDGFERLIGSNSERLVDRMLESLPPDAHIMIGSRQAPGTWYLQRELRGLASTVDARELRLTQDEIVALLPARFTSAETQRVAQLTEGWPVAVQLTRLRAGTIASITEMLDRLPHDGLGLFELLASRVTEALTPAQRLMLRDTSILLVVTPPMVNALMERSDGHALLSGVLQLQPIVTITGDREFTIRLHPLFRQYLRLDLAREGEAYERRLHRRAAIALAAGGSIHEAVQHALAATDLNLAVDLFEQAGGASLIFHVGPLQLISLVAILPAKAREQSMQLRLADLILAAINGKARKVAVLREEMLRSLESDDRDLLPAQRAYVVGVTDMLLALLSDSYEGAPATVLERSTEVEGMARQHFPADETCLGLVLAIEVILVTRYGNSGDMRRTLSDYVSVCERNNFAPRLPSVRPQRGLIAFLSGDYDSAGELLASGHGAPTDRFAEPEPLLIQLSTAILAAMHYERNEPDAAWLLISQLEIDADRTFPESWALAARTRILSLEALGRSEHADQVIERERGVARIRDATRFLTFLDAIALELDGRREAQCAATGRLALAMEAELDRGAASWIMLEQLARAVVPCLAREGQAGRALELAGRFMAHAASCGHEPRVALGHLLVAHVAHATGEHATVQQHLVAALSRTSRTRSIRPYLDFRGSDLTHLVKVLSDPAATRFSDHLRAILRALEVLPLEDPSGWKSLSERERDVLSALSSHATTKAIAKHLALSPETVKHHLKRIFAKLGVHSRDEALKRVAERSS